MQETQEIGESLNKYYLAPVAGVVGTFVANHYYPPLDTSLLVGLGWVPLVILMAARYKLWHGARLSSDVASAKQLYVWAGVGLIVLAAFIFLNGALDNSPSVQVQTHVALKYARWSHSLTVTPSWREGRNEERLEVNGKTFYMVQVGDPVLVVVHSGAFRLPWVSGVPPG